MGQYVCMDLQNKVMVSYPIRYSNKTYYEKALSVVAGCKSVGELKKSFSIEGKILMECYGSFLGFIRRSLNELFKKYKLADSIRVWLDG